MRTYRILGFPVVEMGQGWVQRTKEEQGPKKRPHPRPKRHGDTFLTLLLATCPYQTNTLPVVNIEPYRIQSMWTLGFVPKWS